MSKLFNKLKKSNNNGNKSPEHAPTKGKVLRDSLNRIEQEGVVRERVEDYEKLVQSQKFIDFNDIPPKEELNRLFEEFLKDFLGDAPGAERDAKEKMMRGQSDQAKWKIIKMNSTMKDKLTEDKPQDFINKLKNSRTNEELIPLLSKLDTIMNSTNTNWGREFVKARGIDILFEGYMKHTAALKRDRPEQTQIVLDICKIIERTLQFHEGVSEFLKIQGGVRELALSLDAKDKNIRRCILSILTTLASLDEGFLSKTTTNLKPESLHRMVADSLEYFRMLRNEPRRFHTIVKLLQETPGTDKYANQMKLKVVQFISVMLALDERGDIREDFESLGLLKLLEELELKIQSSEDVTDQQIVKFIDVIRTVAHDREASESPLVVLARLLRGDQIGYELSFKIEQFLSLLCKAVKDKHLRRSSMDEISEIINGQVSLSKLRDRMKAQTLDILSLQEQIKKEKETSSSSLKDIEKLEKTNSTLKSQVDRLTLSLRETTKYLEKLKEQTRSPKADSTPSTPITTNIVAEEIEKENILLKRKIQQLTEELSQVKALRHTNTQTTESDSPVSLSFGPPPLPVSNKSSTPSPPGPPPPPPFAKIQSSAIPPPPPPMSTSFVLAPKPVSGPPPPPLPPFTSKLVPLITVSPPPPPPPLFAMGGAPPPPMGGNNPPPPPPLHAMATVAPPPPPPFTMGGAPPPPPMMGGPPVPPPPMMSGRPAPPPLSMAGIVLPPTGLGCFSPLSHPVSPQNNLPLLPSLKPKEAMKTFNWLKINDSSVENTIWIKSGIVQKIDTVKLRVDTLEQLFSQRKVEKKVDLSGQSTAKPTTKVTTLINDGKRQQQLSIFLGFLRKSNEVIKQAIIDMDTSVLDSEIIAKLVDMAPTPEEINKINEFEGDENILSIPDKFLKTLSVIPRLKFRLEAWDFVLKCESMIASIQPDITKTKIACKELQQSMKWKEVLKVVLAVGNFINAQNNRMNNTYGFKIKSLNKIKETKAQDNKTTLLQYLVTYVEEEYPHLLNFVSDEMSNVDGATKIVFETIELEMAKLKKGKALVIRELEQARKANMENDRFAQVLEQFVNEHVPGIEVLEKSYQEMQADLKDVAELYGEDPTKLPKKPEEFFQDVKEFFNDWNTAYKKLQDDKLSLEKKQVPARSPVASDCNKSPKGGSTDDAAKNLARLLDPSAILMRREQMKNRRKSTAIKL